MAATKSLGTLTVDLIAKTGGWTAGLTAAEREAEKRTRRIKGQFRQLKEEAKVLGKSTAAGVLGAVTGATAALVAMTKQGTDSVIQLNNMAKQIGVTTNELTSLRYAAQQMVGIGEGQFDTAFRRMTRRVSDFATTGSGAAAGALKTLRLEAKELARLTPEQQFKLIAERMSELPSEAQRTALAFRIFGAEGQALGSAFADGAAGIEDMQKQAKDLGLTIDQIEANKISMLDAAVTEANASFDSFKMHLAGEFAPVLTEIVKSAKAMIDEFGGIDAVAERAFSAAIDGSAFAMDAVEGLRRVFEITGKGGVAAFLAIKAQILSMAADIINSPVAAINILIEQLNKIPKINIEQIEFLELGEKAKEASEAAALAARIGVNDIHETLMQPLPSENLREWVQAVSDAADEAAQIVENKYIAPLSDLAGGDEKADERAEAALERLRKQLLNERQVIEEERLEREAVLELAREQAIINEQTHLDMLEQVNIDYQNKITDLEEKAAKDRERIAKQEQQAKMDATKTALANLSTLMNGHSRKMFEVGKAAAISNTVVNTAAAAMGAYNSLSSIPYVGPVLGAAAAAAAVAAGAVQIQNIRRSSFGKGGVSSGVSATAAINDSSQPVDGAPQQQAPRQDVYFKGLERGSLYDGGELIEAINEAVANGGRIMGIG